MHKFIAQNDFSQQNTLLPSNKKCSAEISCPTPASSSALLYLSNGILFSSQLHKSVPLENLQPAPNANGALCTPCLVTQHCLHVAWTSIRQQFWPTFYCQHHVRTHAKNRKSPTFAPYFFGVAFCGLQTVSILQWFLLWKLAMFSVFAKFSKLSRVCLHTITLHQRTPSSVMAKGPRFPRLWEALNVRANDAHVCWMTLRPFATMCHQQHCCFDCGHPRRASSKSKLPCKWDGLIYEDTQTSIHPPPPHPNPTQRCLSWMQQNKRSDLSLLLTLCLLTAEQIKRARRTCIKARMQDDRFGEAARSLRFGMRCVKARRTWERHKLNIMLTELAFVHKEIHHKKRKRNHKSRIGFMRRLQQRKSSALCSQKQVKVGSIRSYKFDKSTSDVTSTLKITRRPGRHTPSVPEAKEALLSCPECTDCESSLSVSVSWFFCIAASKTLRTKVWIPTPKTQTQGWRILGWQPYPRGRHWDGSQPVSANVTACTIRKILQESVLRLHVPQSCENRDASRIQLAPSSWQCPRPLSPWRDTGAFAHPQFQHSNQHRSVPDTEQWWSGHSTRLQSEAKSCSNSYSSSGSLGQWEVERSRSVLCWRRCAKTSFGCRGTVLWGLRHVPTRRDTRPGIPGERLLVGAFQFGEPRFQHYRENKKRKAQLWHRLQLIIQTANTHAFWEEKKLPTLRIQLASKSSPWRLPSMSTHWQLTCETPKHPCEYFKRKTTCCSLRSQFCLFPQLRPSELFTG